MRVKIINSFLFFFLLLVIACTNGNKETKSDNTGKDTANTLTIPANEQQFDSAAMAKAFENFMTPGEMHKWMAKLNGTWQVDVSHWMDASGKPENAKAINVVNTTLNGLYQEGKLTGTIMGMPMEGHSTMAYDNAKKMFVSTWIDNMGSGITIMTGQYDEVSKTLNMTGTQTSPMTGKDVPIRQVTKILDDNKYLLEMYMPGPDGEEMRFMEGKFSRIK